MIPMTTSRFKSRSVRAASSIAYVLPTPGAAPKKTVSLPRRSLRSSASTWRSSSSGSRRPSLISTDYPTISRALVHLIEREIQVDDVDVRLAEYAEIGGFHELGDELADACLVEP